jgi:uncharacterized integral membrane protein
MGYDWGMTDHTQPPADRQSPSAPAQPTAPATEPAHTPPPAPGPTSGRSSAGKPAKDPLRGSRTSGLWASVIALGLVLLLLIIFVAQNTQKVNVSFLGWDGQTPLAVALLIATTAGLFIAAVAGSLRILQLRRRVRHGAS